MHEKTLLKKLLSSKKVSFLEEPQPFSFTSIPFISVFMKFKKTYKLTLLYMKTQLLTLTNLIITQGSKFLISYKPLGFTMA